jgi:DnaJ-class molecular chaperone
MVVNSHYETLGVSTDSNEAEIKKAYRGLSLKYHPDRNNSEDAIDKIFKINEAYEVIGDVESRKVYDMQSNVQTCTDDPFADINNIFNMVFNGHIPPGIQVFHQNGPGTNCNIRTQTFRFNSQPVTINSEATITLAESYSGCVYNVIINREINNNNICLNETENLYVNIPPGIKSNEIINLNEKGNILNNIKGHINIKIIVKNDTLFIRDELDLIYNMKIKLKDSLCGFTQEIIHLNGKSMTLNCSTSDFVIYPGFKKTIPNLGMIQNNITGNLIIIFDVIFPKSLSKPQIDELNKVL